MTPGQPAGQLRPTKRPWVARHKIAIVLLALLGVGILGAVFGDDEQASASSAGSSATSTTSTTTAPVSTVEETTPTEETTTTTTAMAAPKPAKELTSGQTNALRSAANLSFAPSSRKARGPAAQSIGRTPVWDGDALEVRPSSRPVRRPART